MIEIIPRVTSTKPLLDMFIPLYGRQFHFRKIFQLEEFRAERNYNDHK